MKLHKLFLFIAVIILAFGITMPVMAQDPLPGIDPLFQSGVVVDEEGNIVEDDGDIVDWAATVDFFKNVGIFILVGCVLILTTERGTEVGKMIARWCAKTKFTRWLYIKGTGSIAMAIVVSFITIYQFDVQLLERFATLRESVDPELLRIINGVFIWLGSSVLHLELPKELQVAKLVKPYGGAKPKPHV